MKRLLQITLVLLITAGLTTIANAQSSNADIEANANVLASVDVTEGDNLNFGDVTVGTPKSISKENGGTFTVKGNGGNLQLEFTLPSNLTDNNSNELPISFSDTDAAWGDDGSADNPFNPNSTPGTTLDITGDTEDGIITVFIGGTVDPSDNQPSGNYSGTINLEATYN